MYKIALFFLVSMFFVENSFASQNNSNGPQQSINSKYLKNGEIQFSVSLPHNYEASEHRYPVLYVLDGQRYFSAAVAIQQTFADSPELPKMIIIGLHNSYPRRTDLLPRNEQNIVDFFAKELIPAIDKQYRTKDERVIFGWELGSHFSSYLLLHKSQLFKGAIASNGGYANEQLLNLYAKLEQKEPDYLYLANSVQDVFTIDRTNRAVELFEQFKPKSLMWKQAHFNGETHVSLPYLAMFHGLKHFYHNYSPLRFSSVKQFEDFGGLPATKAYYTARAKRFGFANNIDDSTKNQLIWLSWKRDNYTYFDFFMTEFADVLQTKRYQSEYWQNRLGQYYLKHKQYDKAIHFFLNAHHNFKKTERIYNGLAQAYTGKSEHQQAAIYAQKAADIAKANK